MITSLNCRTKHHHIFLSSLRSGRRTRTPPVFPTPRPEARSANKRVKILRPCSSRRHCTNYCHDLRELDLGRSFRLSATGPCTLRRPGTLVSTSAGCSSFSDAALVFLSSQCKKLRCLNLCGCVRAASDRSLQVLRLQKRCSLALAFIFLLFWCCSPSPSP